MFLFSFLLLGLAIENLADILTTAEPLEFARNWFIKTLPEFAKLATCKYCLSFWLSIFFFCFWMLPEPLIYAIALHRIMQLISEFFDRYLNRAPISLYVQQSKDVQEFESSEK